MGLQNCGLNIDAARREMNPHGTSEFPCAGYLCRLSDLPTDAIIWHRHEELEIIYIQEGTMKLLVPGEEYHLAKGEIALINSDILHYAIGDPFCELHSAVFSHVLVSGGNTTAFYKKYVYPLLAFPGFTVWRTGRQDLAEDFQAAFSALETDAFACEFTVRERLSRILLSCFQAFAPQLPTQRSGKNTDTVRIERMLEYIHTHYFEPLQLSDIAQAADLSERECLRCFNRTIGDTPVQYLLKHRLLRSAAMLHSMPSASIAEISAKCGFDHPSYYTKQFRRFYQCTPRDYRSQRV